MSKIINSHNLCPPHAVIGQITCFSNNSLYSFFRPRERNRSEKAFSSGSKQSSSLKIAPLDIAKINIPQRQTHSQHSSLQTQQNSVLLQKANNKKYLQCIRMCTQSLRLISFELPIYQFKCIETTTLSHHKVAFKHLFILSLNKMYHVLMKCNS